MVGFITETIQGQIVFVIVFLFVRSCLLITLVTCLKGHKSLRVLFGSVFQNRQSVSQWVSEWVSDKGTYRAVRWQLKIPQSCMVMRFWHWKVSGSKVVVVMVPVLCQWWYGVGYGVFGDKPNLLYLSIHIQKTKNHICTTMRSKILRQTTLKKERKDIC